MIPAAAVARDPKPLPASPCLHAARRARIPPCSGPASCPPIGFPRSAPDDRPQPNPQLFDHRPHRPRQVHHRRPLYPDLRGSRSAGDVGTSAGLHGPGAGTGHHHQGPERYPGLQGEERPDLPPQLHRHPGARGLLLRGIAFARRLRGGAPGRGRCPGGRGPERGQLLHGHRAGARGPAGPEQDRPALGGPGQGDHRDRRDHWHRCQSCPAGERQDGGGHPGSFGGPDRAHPRPQGGCGGPAAGPDHRLLVRFLRRCGITDPRHAGRDQ